ncbi:MAG TPA: tyrosine-type recombinase/integrase [Leptolyngbyaceae cyanobacterium]
MLATSTARMRQAKRTSQQMRDGREYLTAVEIETLLNTAKSASSGEFLKCRNYALILLAFRHGLRVSEAVDTKWASIDLQSARFWVNRLKGSISGSHPLGKDEVRSLKKLRSLNVHTPWVFTTSQGVPINEASARKCVERLGVKASLSIPIHFHMLRHSCGYALANAGRDTRLIQDWLGHRDIKNTAKYTALAPNRFEGLWED